MGKALAICSKEWWKYRRKVLLWSTRKVCSFQIWDL